MSSKVSNGARRVIELLPAIVALLGAIGAAITIINQVIEAGQKTRSAALGLRNSWRDSRAASHDAIVNAYAPTMDEGPQLDQLDNGHVTRFPYAGGAIRSTGS